VEEKKETSDGEDSDDIVHTEKRMLIQGDVGGSHRGSGNKKKTPEQEDSNIHIISPIIANHE